jgi:hypothetical protein
MERKYFSVGEKVGLVSKHYPELNGEYTISGYGGYTLARDRDTGYVGYHHAYTLKGITPHYGEKERWWFQFALRKIHKSGGTSFKYMMDKLSAQEKAMNLIKNNVGDVK